MTKENRSGLQEKAKKAHQTTKADIYRQLYVRENQEEPQRSTIARENL